VPGHDELKALLGRIRRRWFAVAALTTVARAALAASIPLAAAGLAGWLLQPAGGTLVALGVLAATGAAAAAAYVALQMRRRPDDCQVARFVEEQVGVDAGSAALCDALVSAVQVAEAPGTHPAAFAGLIVANAVSMLQGVEPSRVIPVAALRRASLQAAGGAAVLAMAMLAASPYVLRAGATAWVVLFPGTLQISVITGDARVAAGRPLEIVATLQGRGARLLGVVPSLVVSADGQQRSVPMVATPEGGFGYRFESVDRSFHYRVAAGATSSRAYAVTALFPARVTRIDLRYEYPAFTSQAVREEEDSGDIYGPAGTRVRLRIHTDKPLRSGELSLADGRPVALATAADRTASADLVLRQDNAYRVRLTDVDGLRSDGDVEYFIRLMDDRPPDVRIVRPAADQGITPLEEVAIEARADDDHGVAQFDLVYAVAGKAPRTVPFTRVNGTDVAKVGSHLLAAEELAVQPGDVITYYARARDVARGKQSSETRSDIFFLEVKPFNEEFVAAQSQAMGGGPAGTQIDGLIAAQKEIINATWNLERRSGAGRSAVDMKAVGQAQAELKTRVEQMVRGGRRGGPGFMPQQIAPPQGGRGRGGDPIGAAVAAMGRAVEQLERASTADAIPHEMAALQGLLQAQAEVRRRQVMQQSANAAGQGGTSRTDRDLSALFDRELQRQQRTNYETPPQSSDRPEREDANDALDRIRDLARRQEELARRQRELANGQLSAEEARRQLDRLTREQQELREQAEQLEKQLQANRASSPGAKPGAGSSERQNATPSPGGSNGQASGDMRRATEQMRNAASEMQRQNAQGAAASGARAAEALRQSERQLRSGSADARQRAAGELQLEARQVAEAQRRTAAESARLEKEGQQANADALRRLAGEKDRLADRVDDLQRGAKQLERDTPGAAGAPFRDAAQRLQGEQVSERMRATAGQIRQRAGATAGTKPSPGQPQGQSASQAQVEQQLSRALDSVVDTLGGNADARRLTDELDRTRGMRERLDRLAQQVREAEQNARAGQQPGRSGTPSPGRSGQTGSQAGGGDGSAQQRLERAREDYARELERSREALGRLGSPQPQNGLGGSTPEQHEYSRSSPGNESFKQDFSGWEKLRQDIDVRLERYEASVAAKLAGKLNADRLSAGGSERVPDAYRQSVARYFESLAKVKQ